jgi:hypothetical protein
MVTYNSFVINFMLQKLLEIFDCFSTRQTPLPFKEAEGSLLRWSKSTNGPCYVPFIRSNSITNDLNKHKFLCKALIEFENHTAS